MARQVLPIIGAAVGGYFGGPTGAQLGYAIGSVVGNAVDPVVIKGPKIGDGGVQTSAEGVYRPVVYGTAAVMGNVIARGNRQVKTVKTTEGKGGGPEYQNQRVYWTFAIRVCEGPIKGIMRIWEDEKLVYDARPESTIQDETLEFGDRIRIYLGDEDQLPDPDLEAYQGVGNTPGYRGSAYVVFPEWDLTDRRESIPNYRFEVTTGGEQLPIDRVDALPFNAAANQSGGLSARSLTTYEANFSPSPFNWQPYVTGEYLNWQPLILFEANLSPLDSGAPCRAQALDEDGVIVFDSGWIGDPAWQLEANNTLTALERTDLLGAISDVTYPAPGEVNPHFDDGRAIWGEVRLAPGKRLHRMRLYRCGLDQFKGAGIALFCHIPDPAKLPTNAVAYKDVFGVGTSDAGVWAAPWGPDYVEVTGGGVSLSDIVFEIHKRCDSSESEFDASQLEDEVYGVVLAGDYTCGDSIRSLMPVYFFDSSEYDAGAGYKINYIKRGAPVVLTLSRDDLVGEPDTSKRQDALERPRVLHMGYQNPLIGYAAAKASPARNSPDILVTGEISVQVPVVFDDVDEAWQRADVMLKQTWVEIAGEEQISVPASFLALVPSDNVGLFIRGQGRRMRITKAYWNGGQVDLTLLQDRQSAYTSNMTGVPLPIPTPPPPSIVGNTIHLPLDIPALNDNNDRLLTYGAASGQTEAWFGAVVERSRDTGSSWSEAARVSSGAVIGTLQETVGAASPHYLDRFNLVKVILFDPRDEISSISNQAFLSEGGSFALSWDGPDGRQWEILQYRDAYKDDGDIWVLGHLARGRLNSVPGEHLPGAFFVLLDSVVSYENVTGDIGGDIQYRATSFGNTPSTTDIYTERYTGQSQREWPVADVLLERSGTSITARAIPRHRFGTETNPVRSANWSGYRWVATDGVNVQTTDGLTEVNTFDVTGWTSPITVTVSQLNRITGPGPSVSEQIA